MSRQLPSAAPSVFLLSVARRSARELARALNRDGAVVVQVPTGALALERARDVQPDVIILEAELPDMAGTHACWLLHRDPRIRRNVPILVLSSDKPTPAERVTALRAGAWDLLTPGADPAEVVLKLQAYVQAKRNIDLAPADALVDPATGLHSRPGLARRARELGALMVRGHGALACVVFTLDAEPADPRASTLVARATRASDVVGALGPSEVAVLAPATGHVGAVKLALRVGDVLRDAISNGGIAARPSALRVGYDAVANLTYDPMDPVELLTHAATAVADGAPESGTPWLRRFDATRPRDRNSGPATRLASAALTSETRSTS